MSNSNMETIIRYAFLVVAGILNVAAFCNVIQCIRMLKSEYRTTFDKVNVYIAIVTELFAIYMFVYIYRM